MGVLVGFMLPSIEDIPRKSKCIAKNIKFGLLIDFNIEIRLSGLDQSLLT
jgi:hypothetical protein